MKELSCKIVSDLVAAGACRGPIIAPTVPRAASCRNPRHDLSCNGAGPAMLFSPLRRVIETPRHHSHILCKSPNSTPANCCDDHRHLPVLSPKRLQRNRRTTASRLSRRPGNQQRVPTCPRRGGRLPCYTSSLRGLRLLLLLDEIASCLRNPFQGLHDIVRGNTLCSEIHHHAFCIVSPKDPINEIITTSLRDMDRAHGAVLPSSYGGQYF